MLEMSFIMIGFAVLFGAALYVDTKFFLPKRTKAYLEAARAINEADQK